MTRIGRSLLAGALLSLVTVLPATAAQADPTLCLRGHVADGAWQAWTCEAGTSWASAGAEGAELDAVQFKATGTGGSTCVTGRVEGEGQLPAVCTADGQVGTLGAYKKLGSIGIGNSAHRTCARGYSTDAGWQSSQCAEGGYTVQIVAGAYKALGVVTANLS
ncbi:hypothetical protein FKR81_07585 [Lentzea tibetensis]|uniref:Uncharacterized protein n=1 Tax=Lentzea tibetensis TaxID=2591470 RepID=A0A563EZ64_9PSEU|nr:hypothetical protein [Lentzea tibetensis]TWP52959.1 hypothetical protein FKR81_07585 [Lentzea tibetensis]